MAFPPMVYPHPPHACRQPAASDLRLSSTWDRIYYLWIRICYCRTRSWFRAEEFFGPLATHSSPFTHSTHSLLLDGQEEIASVSRGLSASHVMSPTTILELNLDPTMYHYVPHSSSSGGETPPPPPHISPPLHLHLHTTHTTHTTSITTNQGRNTHDIISPCHPLGKQENK